jgi:hypothetical protein
MADRDSRDRFCGWSGAWAHPRSPAGEGGPGSFRFSGSTPGWLSTPLPCIDSPSSRHVDWRGELASAGLPDPSRRDAEQAPLSGKALISSGLGSVVRIPVPGTNGLAIELTPRGWTPKGGSTSSIFIQDVTGKRQLRLDYGFNKNAGTVEWHWNQKGVADVFGITNHTSVGAAEQALGTAAKYYRYAGRMLLIAGVLVDGYSIVVSSKPLRRTIQVVSAWAGAEAGCEVVGAGGAVAGTAVTPGLGTAIGGLAGCALGGFIGYMAAEKAGGYIYDWAEGTVFTKVEPGGGEQSGGAFNGIGANGHR